MPVNEVSNDVHTGEAIPSAQGIAGNETDQKTKLVAKDKIASPQGAPPSASYSPSGYFIYALMDRLFGKTPAPVSPPDNIPKLPEPPPAPPSCDSLWSQRDLPRLFDLIEKKMYTPQGITWRPKANLDRLPTLKGDSTYLNKFARDLTEEAMEGKLSPFVGREKQIAQIAAILMQRQMNNPLLVGDPGVGKSAIAEGIAQMIVQNDEKLSPVFKDKRIYLIQSELLADRVQKLPGSDLGKVLVKLIAETHANQDQVILVIDEIHAFLKDKETSVVLKRLLADGIISCIATTTPLDYKKMMWHDFTLMLQFPTVHVKEPSKQQTLEILKAFIPRLESRHGVRISEKAIEECLTLSKRFIKNEHFPNKATDLLDQAASFASLTEMPRVDAILRNQQWAVFLDRLLLMRKEVDDPQLIDQKIQEIHSRFTQVTADHIRAIVARKTGIPINKLLEPEKNSVVNQEKLISDVWEN